MQKISVQPKGCMMRQAKKGDYIMKKFKENSIPICLGLLTLLLVPISYTGKLIILSIIMIGYCSYKVVVISRDYLLDKRVRAFLAEQKLARLRKKQYFAIYKSISNNL